MSPVGNVVRAWQPWSQLLPSLAGAAVIVYVLGRLYLEDRGRQATIEAGAACR